MEHEAVLRSAQRNTPPGQREQLRIRLRSLRGQLGGAASAGVPVVVVVLDMCTFVCAAPGPPNYRCEASHDVPRLKVSLKVASASPCRVRLPSSALPHPTHPRTSCSINQYRPPAHIAQVLFVCMAARVVLHTARGVLLLMLLAYVTGSLVLVAAMGPPAACAARCTLFALHAPSHTAFCARIAR